MPQPRQEPQIAQEPPPVSLTLEDFSRDTLTVSAPSDEQAAMWRADIDPWHLRVSINGGDDIVLLDEAAVCELVDFLDAWLGGAK